MKKFLIYLVITTIGLTSFSCATAQDSTSLVKANTITSVTFDAPVIWTPSPPQTAKTRKASVTPTSVAQPTATMTLLPYWGTSVSSQFEGRWVEYVNQDYGFSFKYPQPNDSNPCGKLIFNSHTHVSQLNFEKGGILIMFSYVGNPDLVAYARNYPSQFNSVLITDVERFFIGEITAVRFIYDGKSSYTKKAYVIKNGIMFDFGFREGKFSECDAPGLPEEQVYESIISSWEFLK